MFVFPSRKIFTAWYQQQAHAQRNTITKIGLYDEFSLKRRMATGPFTKLLPGLQTVVLLVQHPRHIQWNYINRLSKFHKQTKWLKDAFGYFERTEVQGRLEIAVM
jgi:hypothetical protein